MEAQRIIITGGATRIGAAIAEKLSGPNKQIVIQYHKSKTKAENLKKKLQNYGTKIYLVKVYKPVLLNVYEKKMGLV